MPPPGQDSPTPRHITDGALTRTRVITACVLVAAIAAAFADSQPTGLGWWDAVLRMSTAALFTLAVSTAHRFVGAVVATIAATFVGFSFWLAVALIGFGVAVVAMWVPLERRVLGAMIGALSIQAMLRFQDFGFFGLPSLIAGATIVAALVLAYRDADVPIRHALRRSVGIACVVAIPLVSIGLVVALTARTDAERGVAAARLGLEAARLGDTQELTVQLNEAEARLATTDRRLGGVLVQPLRLVPILAQHQHAAATSAHQGALVAAEALGAATEADIDELRFEQGQFDLEVLARMAPRLDSIANRLGEAGLRIETSRSSWLVPQLDNRLASLVAEVDDLLPEARLAAQAATVLPAMLGADEPRRYVILFGSPGETREMGGFISGFALIEFDGGEFDLVESGRVWEMVRFGDNTALDDPEGYPAEFLAADPVTFPQNLTNTPDVSVVARAVRDVFPELAGAPIDGIVYVDPFAIAAMLEFTGPIDIAGRPEPLTSLTLTDFIFEDQYRIYSEDEDRFSAMLSVLDATFAGLQNSDLPGPEELGRVLGPAARQGRLQVATFDEAENAFLRSARVQRTFVAPAEADWFALTQANATASKLDIYLQRLVNYAVTVGSSGDVRAIVDIELRSEIPDDAPSYTMANLTAEPTTNRVLLSIYTPHELTSLSVDGQPHESVLRHEYGFNHYALFGVPVRAGSSVTVRLELAGTANAENYRLAVWQQPLVNPDLMQVDHTGPDGSSETVSFELVENALVQLGQ